MTSYTLWGVLKGVKTAVASDTSAKAILGHLNARNQLPFEGWAIQASDGKLLTPFELARAAASGSD